MQYLESIETGAVEALINNLTDDQLPMVYTRSNNIQYQPSLFSSVWENRDTGGDWIGQYGKLGHYIIGLPHVYPDTIKMRISGTTFSIKNKTK